MSNNPNGLRADLCPRCKSEDIQGDAFDCENNLVSQKCFCSECEHDWTNVYSLERQEEPERAAPQAKSYAILVPIAESIPGALIDPGSAVVTPIASESADGTIKVHFESNRLGASNLNRFVEKLNQAAGRADQKYPSVARGTFHSSAFTVVGTFDLTTRSITQITDVSALEAWAGPIGDLRM